MAVFSMVKGALDDVWGDLWTAMVCSCLWLLSLVLVLPAPPATFGLFYYTNRLVNGEVADLKDFLTGFRRYWKVSYRWALLNLAALLILIVDYRFTGQAGDSPWIQFAQGLYLTLTGFWLILQFYALPFIFEQETPSLRGALRNAAVMIGKNPLFCLLTVVLLAAVLLVGALLFMISVPVAGCLLGCTANRAVLNRLQANIQASTSP